MIFIDLRAGACRSRDRRQVLRRVCHTITVVVQSSSPCHRNRYFVEKHGRPHQGDRVCRSRLCLRPSGETPSPRAFNGSTGQAEMRRRALQERMGGVRGGWVADASSIQSSSILLKKEKANPALPLPSTFPLLLLLLLVVALFGTPRRRVVQSVHIHGRSMAERKGDDRNSFAPFRHVACAQCPL